MNLGAVFSAIDPIAALVVGLALGVITTLCVVRWSPERWSPERWSPARQNQKNPTTGPLSGLFARDTLDNQLARVADPQARMEREDRAASLVRAKMFARKSAQSPRAFTKDGPHYAKRYDHAAVLDHIAKVMRAGTESDETANADPAGSGEWEEMLLLPAPSPTDDAAKAA